VCFTAIQGSGNGRRLLIIYVRMIHTHTQLWMPACTHAASHTASIESSHMSSHVSHYNPMHRARRRWGVARAAVLVRTRPAHHRPAHGIIQHQHQHQHQHQQLVATAPVAAARCCGRRPRASRSRGLQPAAIRKAAASASASSQARGRSLLWYVPTPGASAVTSSRARPTLLPPAPSATRDACPSGLAARHPQAHLQAGADRAGRGPPRTSRG
jgi:hypothetical protein